MLVAGTVLMVLLGLIYAWSIFAAPLEKEFGWTRAETSFTFTVSISFFVIGLIANGFLVKRLSSRAILLLDAALLLAGFALCSRINALWGLYLAYGVLVGFAVGIGNNILVSTIVKWFPGKTGIASGVLMMGFGVGGMILGPVAASLMQPESIGWRQTFLLFGVVFAVLFALGAFLIAPPKAGEVPAPAASAKQSAVIDRSASEIVRRPTFWLYLCWFTLLMAGGLIVIGHAATFAGTLGVTAVAAATYTGILSICNGGGRILTGYVYDRLGIRTSMLFTSIYMVVAAASLQGACLTGSIPLMVIGFIFTGLGYGGSPTTSSAFASGFYGMKHFSMNYAIVSFGMIPGALLGPFLAGNLFTSSGAYLTSFIAMFVFSVLCLGFSRLIKKP
jgi:OFA family oxalate/formate antiporter-like MFS transporter